MSENVTENLNETNGITESATYDRDEPLSTAVIDAVADAADLDPAEIGTPLYDQIDPDALDNLFSDKHNGMPRGSGHVVFHLLDYEVTVYSDGYVVVRE
ncbi:HalOD1 output domain-containing protein [Halorussus caseinilyticus]|uniref:HalOD1 output domain-containing protein n=1 Tax=Halorussus caseinilyticus TaxID=3034025 RepID=A0ABD5WPD1_9EURY|nr:HalOD1 output domain-containing protein [Halorussus sp. DT72]